MVALLFSTSSQNVETEKRGDTAAVPPTSICASIVLHKALACEKGRQVQLMSFSVRRSLSFRPERWLGEGGLSASSAKRISMPFGAGPRICPGRYLALQE